MSTFLRRTRLRVLLIRMLAGYAPTAGRLQWVISAQSARRLS